METAFQDFQNCHPTIHYTKSVENKLKPIFDLIKEKNITPSSVKIVKDKGDSYISIYPLPA